MGRKPVLTGSSAATMRYVMNAIIPEGGAFAAGASQYDLIPRANEVLRSYNPSIARAFPFILLYIQASAFLRHGRPFTRLSIEKAGAFLEGMEHSPFYHRRMTILIMKLITCLVFYEIDELAAQIGYTHGCQRETRSVSRTRVAGKKKPAARKGR